MSAPSMLRPWVASQSATRLLMCPFAGSSSTAFRSWQAQQDGRLEITLALYPGRDQRMQEPCAASIEALAESLTAALSRLPAADLQRLLLAGHSMGAQLAFEACLRLEQLGTPPRALVLSACHAPHLRTRRRLSDLADEEFLEQLQQIGGCSPALLADASLMAAFLPMLRADFRATDNYHRALAPARVRLRTPTLLICGSADEEALPGEVRAWQKWLRHTLTPLPLQMEGDHFYVTRQPRIFLSHILQHINRE